MARAGKKTALLPTANTHFLLEGLQRNQLPHHTLGVCSQWLVGSGSCTADRGLVSREKSGSGGFWRRGSALGRGDEKVAFQSGLGEQVVEAHPVIDARADP